MNPYDIEKYELSCRAAKYQGIASILIPCANPEIALELKRRKRDCLFCTIFISC
jgi:hypothetical protein